MNLSEKIANVQPSATLGITSRAKAMIKEGKDVVVLAAGEPDFDTPDIIKEAAIKAIQKGFTKYTPTSGTVSLKEAICRKLKKDNGLTYSPDEIIVSNGAKHSLYNIFQVLLNPGDEVLIISPFWLSYPEMVKLAGGIPKIIKTDVKKGFKASTEDVKKNITKKTKALIVNSPSNPAGVVYDEKELRAMTDVCFKNGVMVVSDEIYEKIIFDGKKHVSPAAFSLEAKEKTLLVNGMSKSFSMTGWRIGYVAGDKALIKEMAKLQDHSTSNPSSISQAAAEAGLNAALDGFMEKNNKMFEKRRDLLVNLLKDEKKIVPFKPEGAFYLFCDISRTGLDSMTFAKRLLEEGGAAVIPGGPFGEDGYIRMSFATSEAMLEKGVTKIKEWIKKI